MVAIPTTSFLSKSRIVLPYPTDLANLSIVSLVTLFSGSSTATSPIGALFANDLAASGLARTLSLSN